MKKYALIGLVYLLMVVFSSNIMAQQPLPLDSTVRYGTLPNGLKYYIKQNKKPENRVEIRLAVNAGSNQEDDNQLGLAHFLEHLAFNGSTHFEKNDLVNFLEGLGVKFGAHLNAYTSFDETVYMLQLPTEDKEVLKKGLLVLEDWASGLSFDSLEIEKERGVVLSEWRTGQGAEMRMLYKFLPIYYYQSRYAERLPIGDTTILKNCAHESIISFYKDWYRPDLMAIMIVGDINTEDMEQEIIARFSTLKNPENERPKIEYKLPKHKENLISICTDNEATNTEAYIIYKHDKEDISTEEGFAKNIANNLINTMFNNRLAELTQKSDAPFIEAATGYDMETRKNDALSSYVFIKKDRYKDAIVSILEENNRVKQHGFEPSELERAKIELLKNYEDAVKEKDKMESRVFINAYVKNFLDKTPALNIETEYNLAKQILSELDLNTLNTMAKSYITTENRVVVITAPSSEKHKLPTEKQILEILDATDRQPLTKYEDVVVNEPLIDFDLKSGEIVSKTVDNKYNIITYTLSNGATVKIKPTDFKNDEIYFSAYSKGGTSLYSDKDYMSVEYSNAIIDDAGIAKFDKTALQKLLTGKTVAISPYIAELDEGFGGKTTQTDLETLMQLLYLYHTQPRKSEEDFNTFMQKEHASYDNLYVNPQYFFYKKMQEVMFQNNIRRNMPTKETLNQINYDSAWKFYQERFDNAADFIYYFVGNIDTAQIESLITKYIASLPGDTSKRENWKDNSIEKPIGYILSDVEMGNTPKTFVGINKHGSFKYSEEEALKFDAMVKILSIILRESLREDKGGVYGVSVQGAVSREPKEKFAVNIMFNADPPKAKELIDAVYQDIIDFITDGATEEKLNKIKETYKRERETDLKENAFWLGKMVYADQYHWDMNRLDNFVPSVDALTLDDIRKVAAQYLKAQNTIQVTLSPSK
jgi:zinc protease